MRHTTLERSPIDGIEVRHGPELLCADERAARSWWEWLLFSWQRCGPEGQYFQPRETP